VNTTPTVSVNSGSICSGNSFTIIPSGAVTHTITGNTFTVTPLVTTSYSVAGSSNAGCVSNTVVALVTVYITPTISANNPTICAGNTAVISPSGSDTFTITGNNFTVTPSASTSYSITGNSLAGCAASNTFVSTVQVNALPVVTVASSSSTICVGETVILTAGGASTYSWSDNQSGASINITPTLNTTFTVVGTDLNGCENSAIITQFTDICAGIRHEQTTSGKFLIKVYPNPNSGEFMVESYFEDSEITVTNLVGEVVCQQTTTTSATGISIKNLAAGIYFVNVKSGKSHETIKVIKN
jgi:hypothetical protein